MSAKHSSLFEFTVVYWRGLRSNLGIRMILIRSFFCGRIFTCSKNEWACKWVGPHFDYPLKQSRKSSLSKAVSSKVVFPKAVSTQSSLDLKQSRPKQSCQKQSRPKAVSIKSSLVKSSLAKSSLDLKQSCQKQSCQKQSQTKAVLSKAVSSKAVSTQIWVQFCQKLPNFRLFNTIFL